MNGGNKNENQDNRQRLIDEYQDVCSKMRLIQKQHHGEYGKEFKKLRKQADLLAKQIAAANSVSKSDTVLPE